MAYDRGRVLAVLNSGIGNTVQALPALRFLSRSISPDNLTIAATPLNSEIVEPLKLGTSCWRLPGDRSILRFLIENPSKLRCFEHVFLFYSCYPGRLDWFRRLGLIRHLWQIDTASMTLPGPSREIMPVQAEMHEADQDLLLVEFAGLGRGARTPSDLGLSAEEKTEARSVLAHRFGVEPGAVWVHPGWLDKTFHKALPPDWTLALLNALQGAGHKPVLVLGPQEADWLARSGLALPDGCRTVAGLMPLRMLAAALASAACLISADSGIGHLASAAGTPLVSCFGPTSLRRCRANGIGPVRVMVAPELTCGGCEEDNRICERPECMSRISVQDVVTAVSGIVAAGCGA
ncbi:MAG: glycosyltransferase family 9 protein [Victivallaceae bacterium]|nr:glycosyltransferase family 9 protein [Victivallaceae bacterium]